MKGAVNGWPVNGVKLDMGEFILVAEVVPCQLTMFPEPDLTSCFGHPLLAINKDANRLKGKHLTRD
jgi:hypothetical protein